VYTTAQMASLGCAIAEVTIRAAAAPASIARTGQPASTCSLRHRHLRRPFHWMQSSGGALRSLRSLQSSHLFATGAGSAMCPHHLLRRICFLQPKALHLARKHPLRTYRPSSQKIISNPVLWKVPIAKTERGGGEVEGCTPTGSVDGLDVVLWAARAGSAVRLAERLKGSVQSFRKCIGLGVCDEGDVATSQGSGVTLGTLCTPSVRTHEIVRSVQTAI